ncbi:alpha/beta fold hydrolase [Parasphingorhabdus litoris]|uniref:Alpha/beta fold hydrolase n=2 Tax=Parasphingorhabdus litoris TaxID=394733 RepID=A0ABN1A0Z4_9SPHN
MKLLPGLTSLIFISACSLITPPNIKPFTLHASATPTGEIPITFEAQSGKTVAAFQGAFVVPENRSSPDSRMLTLRYVRFPATGKKNGPPIVYLAGGPGGSGIATAKWRRFPLFMAMREFGDVIALDQRGTGASNDMPECSSPFTIDDASALDDAKYIAMNQQALRWCIGFWKDKGIDLNGYTTIESVNDLDALRVHLGAKKISLWGTSYGSHLSLAALKEMDDRIQKVVISSVEGLNQTIKRPARTDAYFQRVQHAVNTDVLLQKKYPDIVDLMHRVHAKLDKAPVLVEVPQKEGAPFPVHIQSRILRQYASGLISDPQRAMSVLAVYRGLDQDDTEPVTELLRRWHEPNAKISFRPMSVIMDVASGITSERRSEIEDEAKTAVLGSFLNFTIHLLDVAPEYDLGDQFREKPVSDTPTLVLSGTLDGRTYVESQLEATSQLRNRQAVTVKNAGHNLFMSSPEVTTTILEFMRGKKVDRRIIEVDLPFK